MVFIKNEWLGKKELTTPLPESPGVYLFKNINHEIIYVGKAKNIKKRVSSYFSNTKKNYKTKTLLKYVEGIDFIVVNSEHDAFLLEDKLIKKHQPRFNINLKDDKSFPFIVIEKKRFPKVYFSRNPDLKPNKNVYGPFSQVRTTSHLLQIIKNHYKLRTCNLNLSEENISKKKFKSCFDYHIKKCNAPCIGLQSEQDYTKSIKEIKKILKGDFHKVLTILKKDMLEYATNYEFEKAQKTKEKINSIKLYQSKNTVINNTYDKLDAVSFKQIGDTLYTNYIMTNEGFILNSFNTNKKVNTTLKKHTSFFLAQQIQNISSELKSQAKEILCDNKLSIKNKKITSNYDTNSNHRKLMSISKKNLEAYIEKTNKENIHSTSFNNQKNELLQNIQTTLRLPNLPKIIESFDNSHLHGKENVSAMVCFKNGLPNKSNYRLFKIKHVNGIDDFASMEEVILRRYKRVIDEKKKLPDLILIDGGKGQLNSAIKSLKKLKIENQVSIIGIAKQKEELFFPEDKDPILLDKYSPVLHFFQRVRDETHRFVITYQKKRRSMNLTKTPLHNIPRFGDKTIQKLLIKYKSIHKMKFADKKDIEALIGKQKTKTLQTFLLTYH